MSPDRPAFLLLTCEHGGREVPEQYRGLFRGRGAILASHRGYDIGALGVALRMASRMSAPLVFSTVTRLLIDLNRSHDGPGVFSEFTLDLPRDERDRITARYHTPHRSSVERTAAAAIAGGHRVVHVGVHSCTDVLDGVERRLDIAMLFDESRHLEHDLCERWRSGLHREAGDLRCPFNEPYRGADDGLTTTLRSRFDPEHYLGIEIELRQGIITRRSEQHKIGELLATTLSALV